MFRCRKLFARGKGTTLGSIDSGERRFIDIAAPPAMLVGSSSRAIFARLG